MSDDLNLDELRERYSSPPEPKCPICGADMDIGTIGNGRVEYVCGSDEANWLYKSTDAEDKKRRFDHYTNSRVAHRMGDSDVLALLDRLAEAEGERDEAQRWVGRAIMTVIKFRPLGWEFDPTDPQLIEGTIEPIVAERDSLKGKGAVLRVALQRIADAWKTYDNWEMAEALPKIAREALANTAQAAQEWRAQVRREALEEAASAANDMAEESMRDDLSGGYACKRLAGRLFDMSRVAQASQVRATELERKVR